MYGPEYVWILNPEAGTVDHWAKSNLVESRKNNSFCTKEELEVVANRTFLLAGNDLRLDNDTKPDSGLVRKKKHNILHACQAPAHKGKNSPSKCATRRLCACV